MSSPTEGPAHQEDAPSAPSPAEGSERPSRFARSLPRLDALFPRALVVLTVVLLAAGWHRTWPDLNRDFNVLHGWADCQDAHMARMFAEEGGWNTGLRPVEYRLHDAADGYRYAHYGILTTALVSLVYEVASPQGEHRALRLAGIFTSCAFLAGLYLLARRLLGDRCAAWALFFGAISPQVLFFGVFPASYVIGNAFAVFAYWAYVAWRDAGRHAHLVASMALLICALLSSIYLVGASVVIGLDFLLNRALPARRRLWLAAAFAFLPMAVLAAQGLHYRLGVEWITGHVPWGSGVAQNVQSRTHLELMMTLDFYKRIVDGLIWSLSPAALVGFASFLAIDAPRAIVRWVAVSHAAAAWRILFVAGTLGLSAIVIPFPQSTLTHDFTWTILLIPMALMVAMFMARTRSLVVSILVVALTTLGAFAGTHRLATTNNSPDGEWQLGVGLRLATPEDSFVPVPWDGSHSAFMLDFYAHRRLLYEVPEQYRAVGIPEPRFVVIAADPVPDDAATIYVPGARETIIDRSPGERLALPESGETFRHGTWRLVSCGLTGDYGGLAIVELEWLPLREDGVPPFIEIGQRVHGAWVRLGLYQLRGDTLAQWPAPRDIAYRDGFLVKLSGAGPIILRVIDRDTGGRIWADSGKQEIYLDDAAGATHELPE